MIQFAGQAPTFTIASRFVPGIGAQYEAPLANPLGQAPTLRTGSGSASAGVASSRAAMQMTLRMAPQVAAFAETAQVPRCMLGRRSAKEHSFLVSALWPASGKASIKASTKDFSEIWPLAVGLKP